jgi:hypothetical protein
MSIFSKSPRVVEAFDMVDRSERFRRAVARESVEGWSERARRDAARNSVDVGAGILFVSLLGS